MSEFRVVVLSEPGFYYRRQLILTELNKIGVSVYALVLSSKRDSLIRKIRTFWKRLNKYGLSFFFDDFLPSRLLRPLENKLKWWKAFTSCQNIVSVPSLGESATQIIKGLSPDLLVLAGVHILPPEILGIPRLGTINGNLGLVPNFRGNYPV